jgi:hypothetical protein
MPGLAADRREHEAAGYRPGRTVSASSPVKVGIGVATGADQVFVGRFDALGVEPDRKLPLVMTRDIDTGSVKWRGLGDRPAPCQRGILRRSPRDGGTDQTVRPSL